MENWKEIDGFLGKYSVSDLGNIRNNDTSRILKTTVTKKGYIKVTIDYKRKKYSYIVSRLVLLAFKPIPNPELYHADHLDFNTMNNHLTNLDWKLCVDNLKRKNPGKISWDDVHSFKLYKRLLLRHGDKHVIEYLRKLK